MYKNKKILGLILARANSKRLPGKNFLKLSGKPLVAWTIEEALKISNRAVADALDGLPPIKMHCSVLAEEALKSAIDDYLAKSKDKNKK